MQLFELGHYSHPHPRLLILNKFHILILKNHLLFPCGIFTWYILPLYQVFFDSSASQSPFPCLQNIFRNKCELTIIIQRIKYLWSDNFLDKRSFETRNMKYTIDFTPFQKFQFICYLPNLPNYLVWAIVSWI